MTLENILQKSIVDAGPAAGRRTIRLPDSSWTLTLNVEKADGLGCLLWDVTARRDAAQSGTQHAWADRLAARVTSLLERLTVHEIDPALHIALLRSASPAESEGAVSYFELELHGTTETRLRRYRGHRDPGHKREQAAFALTYEALARLAADLTAEK